MLKDRTPLLADDTHPYVKAILHFNWAELDECYQLFQRLEASESKRFTTSAHPTIYPLGMVCCTYSPREKYLSVTSWRTSNGSHPSFIFWAGTLNRSHIRGWPYEDLLYNLLRVYSAVSYHTGMCSTSVFPPSAHEQADSIGVISMLQQWYTLP